MKKTEHKAHRPPDLPTAPYEVQRSYRAAYSDVKILQTILQATEGVFRPGPDDPKTWYGRAFRFIGLICIYFVIAMLILVAVQDSQADSQVIGMRWQKCQAKRYVC